MNGMKADGGGGGGFSEVACVYTRACSLEIGLGRVKLW